jgi:hypothetical protein
MFEPLKLISVGLTLVLLAPFGFVFWVLATHAPRSESERRAELEAAMREQSARVGTTNADGSFVGGVGVSIGESLAFSRSTVSWLSFYPRQWVGWLGLGAVAIIAFCIILSLFFPGSTEISASTWNNPPPTQTPTP